MSENRDESLDKEKKKVSGRFVAYITVNGEKIYAKQRGKRAFFIPDKE